MLTLRAAGSVLSQAISLDDLVGLVRHAGCNGPLDLLAPMSRKALGLDDSTREAAIVSGTGALRGLALILENGGSLRSVLSTIARTLTARSPEPLWLVVAAQADGSELGVATWTCDRRGTRRTPSVAALIADRRAVLDSDADTMRALSTAADDDDLVVHARWIDILGREAVSRRFFRALETQIAAIADSSPRGDDATRAEMALLCASRLLFLSFLEAKGWLDGDQSFLSHHFDTCMRGSGGFHRRVLDPLMFGTLNTPIRQRAAVARRFGRIPFLNGGLFARAAIEKRDRGIVFGDPELGGLFSNVLGRFRFTAGERTSTFQEAAIDPEMLGRAFESLMDAGARRASGAFYTPAALVERLTTFGLSDVLSSTLGAPLAERVLESKRLTALDQTRAHDALSRLTIVDPACGSGAFLVHLLDRVTTLQAALNDDRPRDLIKRDILARSIFGVDVNPTAVWLCELRLWLAVVIDSPNGPDTPILPLPNLDRNIRVGDSLAGAGFQEAPRETAGPLGQLRLRYTRATGFRKRDLGRMLDREERRAAIAELEAAMQLTSGQRRDLLTAQRGRDLFGERNVSTAETERRTTELKARSAELRAKRRRVLEGGALPFSWHSVFPDIGRLGGFGLVVGNPPWVRPHHIAVADREDLRRRYEVARNGGWRGGAALSRAGPGFSGQVDLSAIFVERALDLVRPSGAIALLLPAKLWRSLSGGSVRQMVLNRSTISRIEDHSDARAQFDASVYPGLTVARRHADAEPRPDGSRPIVVAVAHRSGVTAEWHTPTNRLSLDPSPGAPWLLLPREVRSAFDALSDAGVQMAHSSFGPPLLGVKCGLNEAFLGQVQARKGADVLVADLEGRTIGMDASMVRPVARGEDVSPWSITCGNHVIVWPHGPTGSAMQELSPAALRWFQPHRRALRDRSDARGNLRWWSLFRTEGARCDRPRVVWVDVGRTPRAAVIAAGDDTVPLNTCYVARCRDQEDALALAMLLNSPIIASWLAVLAEPARGGYRRYLGWTMSLLPIPADWERARVELAAAAREAMANPQKSRAEHIQVVLSAYGVRYPDIAPLMVWADA